MVWMIHAILGENAQLRGHIVTKTDVEYMLNRAEKEKSIDSKQIELLTSIMDFPAIRVKDIMVPRSKVKFITSKMTYEEVLNYIQIDHYSRYPVCAGDLEHTIGLLHVKDLSLVTQTRKEFRLKTSQDFFFVYEHEDQCSFDLMNERFICRSKMKGIIVGVISMEDIVEQIVEISVTSMMRRYINIKYSVRLGILVPGTLLYVISTDYELNSLERYLFYFGWFHFDMLGTIFPRKAIDSMGQAIDLLVEIEMRIINRSTIQNIFSKRESGRGSAESNVKDGVKRGLR